MSRTRPASVDDVRKQWQAAGQALHPFCSFEELASVIEAMAVFPVGTPKRAQRVCDWLGKRSDVGAFAMDAALKRLDVSASAVIERLSSPDGLVLVTDRESCAVNKCGGKLCLPACEQHRARPTVYTDRGVLSGELIWKRCERCDARHYLSYAVSGYHIPSGQARSTAPSRSRRSISSCTRSSSRTACHRPTCLSTTTPATSPYHTHACANKPHPSAMLPSLSADRCSATHPTHACANEIPNSSLQFQVTGFSHREGGRPTERLPTERLQGLRGF
jgi:hypothetical protein